MKMSKRKAEDVKNKIDGIQLGSLSKEEAMKACIGPVITVQPPWCFMFGTNAAQKRVENRHFSLNSTTSGRNYNGIPIGIYCPKAPKSIKDMKKWYSSQMVRNAFKHHERPEWRNMKADELIKETAEAYAGKIIGSVIFYDYPKKAQCTFKFKNYPKEKKFHWYVHEVVWIPFGIPGFKPNQTWTWIENGIRVKQYLRNLPHRFKVVQFIFITCSVLFHLFFIQNQQI